MGVKIKGNTCVSSTFKGVSSVVIPQRPEEPFLFPVAIGATGGVAPYFTQNDYGNITEEKFSSINDYDTTEGVISYNGDTTILENITYGSVSNFPQFQFNSIKTFDISKNYKIKFSYEKISGNIDDIGFMIGWGSGEIVNIPLSDSGEVEINYSTTGVVGLELNYFRLITNGYLFKLNVTGFEIFVLEEFEETYSGIEKTFGYHSFIITDSVGNECSTSINIEIPTPLPNMLSVKPFETQTMANGSNVRLYIQGWSPSRDLYINWGDGNLEKFIGSDGDRYHTYADTHKRYDIDIYGDGLRGLYSGYYRNTLLISVDYLNSMMGDVVYGKLSQVTLYHGEIVGSFNRLNIPLYHLFMDYNSFIEGDIGEMQESYYLSSVKLATVYEPTHGNFQPSLYGDIGTFLKGNYRDDYGGYTKYIDVSRTGRYTYLDRIDGPIRSNRMRIRGYSTSQPYYLGITDPNQVAQLLVDLDTHLLRSSYKQIMLTYNASPNDADEPLLSEFIAAKANLIADGFAVYHS